MKYHLRALALTERQVLLSHARWMTWNLLLALVPLGLALVLFRRGRRRGFLWWVGVGGFVAFLPNAPYVLTDAVHLVADVRHIHHPSALLFGVLPLYGLFFLTGFACYVVSVVQVRRYIRETGRPALALAAEACLHVLTAVGIFLGRFDRLNSWDVFARPAAIATAIGHLTNARPVFVIGALLVVITAGTGVAVSGARAFGRTVDRLRVAGAALSTATARSRMGEL